MVEWCPKCGAMLSPGLEKCPRCGKKLPKKGNSGYTMKDILWISMIIFGFVLIPIILFAVIGLLCTSVGS
jgi:uncharacterized paraquat-inducible protein A